MNRRTAVVRESAIGGVLVMAGAAIMVTSFAHPPNPPGLQDPIGPLGLARATAVVLVVCGVLLATRTVKHRQRVEQPAEQPAGLDLSAAEPQALAAEPSPGPSARGLLAVGTFILYIAVLPWLGFIVATLGFSWALLLILGIRRIIPLLIGGAVVAPVVYWLFTTVLNVRLP